MLVRIAERVEHYQRVGHRRKDGADPVFAVKARRDESHRFVDGALADTFGKQWLAGTQQGVDRAEHQEPWPFLMRRLARRAQ